MGKNKQVGNRLELGHWEGDSIILRSQSGDWRSRERTNGAPLSPWSNENPFFSRPAPYLQKTLPKWPMPLWIR